MTTIKKAINKHNESKLLTNTTETREKKVRTQREKTMYAQTQREKKIICTNKSRENYAQTRGEKTINKLNVRKL